jgi:hypothetical protein
MARVERRSVVEVAVLEVAPGAGSEVTQLYGAVGGSSRGTTRKEPSGSWLPSVPVVVVVGRALRRGVVYRRSRALARLSTGERPCRSDSHQIL